MRIEAIEGIVAGTFNFPDTVVPMRKRFAPLVPLALIALLTACAGQPTQPDTAYTSAPSGQVFDQAAIDFDTVEPGEQEFSDDTAYQLPQLADSILERGFTLVGTPYRYGGNSVKTGFDCSGFVGFSCSAKVARASAAAFDPRADQPRRAGGQA
ncbi:hypothetical protein SSTU70S_01108 [Stutzerimonas stutzeri]